MAANRRPSQFGDETGGFAPLWNVYDQQGSDEDDDEPRLMIDTSGEEDEGSSTSSRSTTTVKARLTSSAAFPAKPNELKRSTSTAPSLKGGLNSRTPRKPAHPAKVMSPATVQSPAATTAVPAKILNDLMKNVSPATDELIKSLKNKKMQPPPPHVGKALVELEPQIVKMINASEPPSFEELLKARAEMENIMKEVKSTPAFERAMKELAQSPELSKVCQELIPKDSNPNKAHCNVTLSNVSSCDRVVNKTVTSSPYVPPLAQLQELVWKPFNKLPNTTISNVSVDNRNCDSAKNVGISSKVTVSGPSPVPVSCVPQPKSRAVNAKSRSQSTVKREILPMPLLRPPFPMTVPNMGNMTTVGAAVPISILPKPPPLQKRPSKLDAVLSKLQNAANDEIQMQELQKLPSDEMEEFKIFQSFVKNKLKDRPLDVPGLPPLVSGIDNAWFQKNMSKLQQRSLQTSMPALTAIPKQMVGQGTARKLMTRRSPPPMVPIESLVNLRKPMHEEDNVIHRLKKLGTDIELERTGFQPQLPRLILQQQQQQQQRQQQLHRFNILGPEIELERIEIPQLQPRPAHFDDEYEEIDDDDGEGMIPLPVAVDCIISTEPIVTIDEKSDSLPYSNFGDQSTNSKHVITSRVPPPPPPSLIPISSSTGNPIHGTRFVPILPHTSKLSEEAWRARGNATTRKRSKSQIAKLAHALVQPAGAIKFDDPKSVIQIPRNDIPEAEVEIFKIDDATECSITTTKAVANDDVAKVDTVDRNLLCSENMQDVVSAVEVSLPTPPASSPPTVPAQLPAAASTTTAVVAPPQVVAPAATPVPMFKFVPESMINMSELPNGRKLFSCDICSGVYYKMHSVKKHYFAHINPRFVTKMDAMKFGLDSWAKTHPSADDGLYRCNECGKIINEKQQLKSHMLEHPPSGRTATDRYNCTRCRLVFNRKKQYQEHLAACGNNMTPAEKPSEVLAVEKCEVVSGAVIDGAESEREVEAVTEPAGPVELPKVDEDERKDDLGISRMCLFCERTFTNVSERNKHVLQLHHPKKKQQTCSYCKNKKFSDLKDLLKHICEAHSKRYFGCANCKIRFKTKDDLTAHNAESHPETECSQAVTENNVSSKKDCSVVINKNGKTFKCNLCPKTFATTKELTGHKKKGHKDWKANNAKAAAAAAAANANGASTTNVYEQKYRNVVIPSTDYETEFYRNIPYNVRCNVELHMDGKIEMRKSGDLKSSTRSNTVVNSKPIVRDMENELTFQEMYGADNMNSKFIRSVSRLHLATQLTILNKTHVLEKDPVRELSSSLHRNSRAIAQELALKETQESTLSSDESKNSPKVVFSGEWIRNKKYICAACFALFNNFWDMEDHRWIKHPNVWGFYYEFVPEQAPGSNWAMKRMLHGNGTLKKIENTNVESQNSTCTKCQKIFTPVAEFHKHILECGGDSTWTSTMFASSSLKKQKRWKPYGGRRRRNTRRVRGLKRNIPTTPVKIVSLQRNRQKAGDTDTIQRMIANLPPKRITRRIVQFDDLDSKSNSRLNNEPNIVTRRRRERLDAKTAAQITKAFSVDSPMLNRTVKKKKSPASVSISDPPSPSSSLSASESGYKRGRTSKSNKPAGESEPTTSETSPSISDTEIIVKEVTNKKEIMVIKEEVTSGEETSAENEMVVVKEEIPSPTDSGLPADEKPSNSPASSTIVVPKLETEPDEDDPTLELQKLEPVELDSVEIPDSSVILAAMRETMRQTDAVIPAQVFNSKKRKRDESKCKKCGTKQEQLNNSVCELCSEPEVKRVPTAMYKLRGSLSVKPESNQSSGDTSLPKNEEVDDETTASSNTKVSIASSEKVLETAGESSKINNEALIEDDSVTSKGHVEDATAIEEWTEYLDCTSDEKNASVKANVTAAVGMKQEEMFRGCRLLTNTLSARKKYEISPGKAAVAVNERKSSSVESVVRRSSSEVSIQVNESEETSVNNVLKSQTAATASELPGDEVACKISTSPSKKNALLMCKGCGGVFDTVSSYKQHCDTCQARASSSEPLLAFAKRTSKSSAESGVGETNGASFEIIEGVQIKPLDAENTKQEVGTSDHLLPIIYDSDSSSSSKRVDHGRNPNKRSIASEASMNQTIEDVIKTICYQSAAKQELSTCEKAETENCEKSTISSRKSSSEVSVCPVDRRPSADIFEQTKNLLQYSLESCGKERFSPKEITFVDTPKSGTDENESRSENLPIGNKTKRLARRERIRTASVGRATRSSLTKIEEPKEEDETAKVKNAKRSRTEEDLSADSSNDAQTETAACASVGPNANPNIGSIATRLRRKSSLKTNTRVLRSRIRLESNDSMNDSTESEAAATLTPESTPKRSDDSIEADFETGIPVSSKSTIDTRKSKRPSETADAAACENAPSSPKTTSEAPFRKAKRARILAAEETSETGESLTACETIQSRKPKRSKELETGSKSSAKTTYEVVSKKSKRVKESKKVVEAEDTKQEPEVEDNPAETETQSIDENFSVKGKRGKRKSDAKRKSVSGPSTPTATAEMPAAELGFVITKTNRTIRKEKLEEGSETEQQPKNELAESERKLRRRSGDSDPSTVIQTLSPAVTANTPQSQLELQQPMGVAQGPDFLEPAAPSACATYNNFDELRMGVNENLYGNPTSLESIGDVPETPAGAAAPQYIEEPAPSSASSWFSDAMNFFGQNSLGTILDSVNELLSRPEVVSSCSNDSMSSQRIQDLREDVMMLQSFEESKNKEIFMEPDEESPTIMDLDSQPAQEPEKTGEVGRTVQNDISDKCQTILEPVCAPVTVTNEIETGPTDQSEKHDQIFEIKEEICDVCEQIYPDANALNLHMVAIHQFDRLGNRCTLNGRQLGSEGKLKMKQRCSHCQKVVGNKSEMASHIKEHLRTFATNKNNAEFLKKCIAEKLEDIFTNKALAGFIKTTQTSSNLKGNIPLKIFSELYAAKKNHFDSWKSTIAQLLINDPNKISNTNEKDAKLTASSVSSSPSPSSCSSTSSSGVSKNANNSKSRIYPKGFGEKMRSKVVTDDDGPPSQDGFPCPVCEKRFQYTHMRNQHLVMVHTPRTPGNKEMKKLAKVKENEAAKKEKIENEKKKKSSSISNNTSGIGVSNDSETNTKPKIKTIDMLRKELQRSAEFKQSSSSSTSTDSNSIELPPALEPETNGELIQNNTDRSPPKLEAPAGIAPVHIRKPSLSSTRGEVGVGNGLIKRSRKKMSKKEMNLPPAVVKLRAEQALLELSISKFQKLR